MLPRKPNYSIICPPPGCLSEEFKIIIQNTQIITQKNLYFCQSFFKIPIDKALFL